MFKVQLAQYINDNMVKHNLTYKDISAKSGVPSTTLSYYARGQVNTPNDEYCAKIAAVFGDPPEVIQQMRREALGSTAAENQLIAGADDKQRMEQYAALMRTNMLAVMEEYRVAAAAQQTEIIQHADRRIEEERARSSELNAKVLQQCNEEVARNKAVYDERYRMMKEHCDQRVADAKAHMADLVQEKRESEEKIGKQYKRNRAYLKSSVRNLCIAGGILLITNIFFGAYAIFAYTVFDMADPTRGLHRETHSVGPMMLFLAIVAIAVAAALVVSMLAKKPKAESEEE